MIMGGRYLNILCFLFCIMDGNTINVQEMSTEDLVKLLAETNRELKRRQPKHPVSILKEWVDVDEKNRGIYVRHINRRVEFGWECVIVMFHGPDVETFSSFVKGEGSVRPKKESQRLASVKAVKDCSFLKIGLN